MEQPVIVGSGEFVVARAVEVPQPPVPRIERDHRDAGLHMRLPVRVAGIGQPEGVDLDQHRSAAPELRHRLRLDRIEDRQLLNRKAEEALQVLERELEEGEVVALEILQHREGERRLGGMAECRQQLDPEVDVAVGLRPDPVAAVQDAGAPCRRADAQQVDAVRVRGHCARRPASRRERSRDGEAARASAARPRSRRMPYGPCRPRTPRSPRLGRRGRDDR